MTKILIVSTRSWGEMGNYHAAQRLAKILCSNLSYQVQVEVMEDFCPAFRHAGQQMREITSDSENLDVRRGRYRELLHSLDNLYPENFEVTPTFFWQGQHILQQLMQDTAPDIVIGTKGFISRLALSAKRAGATTSFVNYITNDGLLQFPLHRSRHPHLQMAQTERGKGMLQSVAAVPEERVVVVGRLVGERPAVDLAGPLEPKPLIAVLANRPGNEFRTLFEALIEMKSAIGALWSIVAGAPEFLDWAKDASPDSWLILPQLSPGEYMERIQKLSRHTNCLLICKAGPNTVFEALAAGIPILALQSGLPMEDWVCDILDEAAAGMAFTNVDDLLSELKVCMADPTRILGYRHNAFHYAEHNLNNAKTVENIIHAIRKINHD